MDRWMSPTQSTSGSCLAVRIRYECASDYLDRYLIGCAADSVENRADAWQRRAGSDWTTFVLSYRVQCTVRVRRRSINTSTSYPYSTLPWSTPHTFVRVVNRNNNGTSNSHVRRKPNSTQVQYTKYSNLTYSCGVHFEYSIPFSSGGTYLYQSLSSSISIPFHTPTLIPVD